MKRGAFIVLEGFFIMSVIASSAFAQVKLCCPCLANDGKPFSATTTPSSLQGVCSSACVSNRGTSNRSKQSWLITGGTCTIDPPSDPDIAARAAGWHILTDKELNNSSYNNFGPVDVGKTLEVTGVWYAHCNRSLGGQTFTQLQAPGRLGIRFYDRTTKKVIFEGFWSVDLKAPIKVPPNATFSFRVDDVIDAGNPSTLDNCYGGPNDDAVLRRGGRLKFIFR